VTDKVVLKTFNTRYEAEAARSLLAGSSIDSIVKADDLGAVDPALGFGRGVDLLVDAQDWDRAVRLLLEAGTKGDDE
jgi:hypothetical protein